jgi:large subunit ribosomal protein L30
VAKVKITLVKSPIGCSETQRKTVKALGLTKVGSSVVQEDSPTVRGNIRKIEHLLSVEEIDA